MSDTIVTENTGALIPGSEQDIEYESRLAAALYRWRALQDRKINPSGSFDNAGRWYPDADEKCEHCDSIRSPSRAYPCSYMVHCRSYTHVAAKSNVRVSDLRREARVCSLYVSQTRSEPVGVPPA